MNLEIFLKNKNILGWGNSIEEDTGMKQHNKLGNIKSVTTFGAYDTWWLVEKDENREEHVGQIIAHKGIMGLALSRQL